MQAVFRSAMVSWKTTTVGVLLFVGELANNLVAVLDANAATEPDWNVVVTSFAAMVALIFAKDGDKSSEDHQ